MTYAAYFGDGTLLFVGDRDRTYLRIVGDDDRIDPPIDLRLLGDDDGRTWYLQTWYRFIGVPVPQCTQQGGPHARDHR